MAQEQDLVVHRAQRRVLGAVTSAFTVLAAAFTAAFIVFPASIATTLTMLASAFAAAFAVLAVASMALLAAMLGVRRPPTEFLASS